MWRVFVLPVFFLVTACDLFEKSTSHVHQSQFFAFGTVIEVSYFESDEALISRANKTLKTDFDYMHEAWHPYEPGPLSRINSLLPFGEKFSIAPSVLPLIKKAKELSPLSDGYFNPAIGELIQLWGFDRAESLNPTAPPKDADIKAWLSDIPTMEDVVLDGLSLQGNNKQIFLDLGGIAKGYGVDRAVQELKKIGLKNFILNAGGDLRAIGSKGGKPWNIGIRHPRGSGVIASIEISNNDSVFTSGDYERYFEFRNKRYHHILNPKTGYPANDFQSVTVVHQDATLADAASTALFVAGKSDWQRIAQRMGISQVMLVDQDGNVILTSNLEKRIKLHDVGKDNVKVVDLQ